MAIRSLTFLDIPASKRRDSAARALIRLQERMGDPSLNPEQRQQLKDQATRLEGWVAGRSPQP